MFAAAKVGVHLSRQNSILGDVRASRVLVQWKEEEPCDAHYKTDGGEVRWELEEDWGAAEGEEARCW